MANGVHCGPGAFWEIKLMSAIMKIVIGRSKDLLVNGEMWSAITWAAAA